MRLILRPVMSPSRNLKALKVSSTRRTQTLQLRSRPSGSPATKTPSNAPEFESARSSGTPPKTINKQSGIGINESQKLSLQPRHAPHHSSLEITRTPSDEISKQYGSAAINPPRLNNPPPGKGRRRKKKTVKHVRLASCTQLSPLLLPCSSNTKTIPAKRSRDTRASWTQALHTNLSYPPPPQRRLPNGRRPSNQTHSKSIFAASVRL